MTDKVYNILKYCALVALPAFGTFYTTVATLWGWSYVEEVSGTILAFDTLLGAFRRYFLCSVPAGSGWGPSR